MFADLPSFSEYDVKVKEAAALECPLISNTCAGDELLKPKFPELSIVRRVFVSISPVPILNLSLSESSTPKVNLFVPLKENPMDESPSGAVLSICN